MIEHLRQTAQNLRVAIRLRVDIIYK